MSFSLLPILLAAVATCMAQNCPSQSSCCSCCAQQPTIIQMSCGNAKIELPPPVYPPSPPPPSARAPPLPRVPTETVTEATTEVDSTTEWLPDTDAEVCYKDNNLVILVDSSGSVNQQDPNNYNLFLNFTAKLAAAWKMNPGNGVAFIIYSGTEQKIFGLEQGKQMDEATMQQTIANAPYLGGGTATHLGLNAAALELNEQSSNNLPKNVVLITDGVSNDQKLTYEAAKKLESTGIKLIAVGVGKGRSMAELENIVNNDTNRVFGAENFTDLLDLTKKISQASC